MSATAMERLAASRLIARLPPAIRPNAFALNNLVYFAGNLFAGVSGFAFQSLLKRSLSDEAFREAYSLISIFYLINIPMFIAMAVAARYTAPLAAQGDSSRVNRAFIDFS